MVGYADTVRLLAAWCELRQAFRHFQTDRIHGAGILTDAYDVKSNELRRRWEDYMQNTRDIRLPEDFT